jgi:murein DD-endopeptidase MepM/ murein hydrolase activator NlpD
MVPASAFADSSSPSPSATPSASAAPSAADTPSPTPNPTPVSTPSQAATPDPSPDPSPSPSDSASPTPSPSPSPTTEPTPTPTPTPTPVTTETPTQTAPTQPPASPPQPDAATQQLIDQARQQLGGGVANALSTVQQLSDVLTQNADEQDQISQRIQSSQDRMDTLDDQIQQLDDDISTTQDRIDTERAQVGVLARQLYQQPDSLLLRLLRAGSLSDMVTQASDMTTAAVRADTLKGKLSSDLARLQQDQADRQRARDEEAQVQEQLDAALTQFEDLADKMQSSSDDLQSLIDDGQAALDGIDAQGVSVAQQAAAMLQKREQSLIAIAEQQVWQQAQLWATLNASAIPAPVATTYQGSPSSPTGTRFGFPIQGAVLTQGFGPTDLALEPSVFGFPHFHTGLDLASKNTRIGAAADGVVAAVGSGTTGYGNYVIIVHGGGLLTLYGHLTVTMVKVGDRVTQGQQIGVEGSTGNSTGVHLHFEVRLNGTPVDPSPYLPPLGSA